MSTTAGLRAPLEDFRVHVKLKIAALWTAVMFCYIYGDIFVLQQPGHLTAIIAGTVWHGGPVTQGMLLAFAVAMAIPSVMVFLSLALKPTINRWTNIGLGLFSTVFMLLTMTATGVWYFYTFLGVVETVLTLSIVWYAVKWPQQEAR